MPLEKPTQTKAASKVTMQHYTNQPGTANYKNGKLSGGTKVTYIPNPQDKPKSAASSLTTIASTGSTAIYDAKVQDVLHDSDTRVPTPIRVMPTLYGLRLLPQSHYAAATTNKAQRGILYATWLDEIYTNYFRLPKEWGPLVISKGEDAIIRQNIKRILDLHDDPLERHEKFLWMHDVFSGALSGRVIDKMRDSEGCPPGYVDRWRAFAQMVEPIGAVYQHYLCYHYAKSCARPHFAPT